MVIFVSKLRLCLEDILHTQFKAQMWPQNRTFHARVQGVEVVSLGPREQAGMSGNRHERAQSKTANGIALRAIDICIARPPSVIEFCRLGSRLEVVGVPW